MANLVQTPTLQHSRQITGSDRHRPDIEGLRAVAVLLIMLFHAGIPVFAGGYIGVDVFFVISGFLITGLLIREIEQTSAIRLSRFYARRIRRLLPAAALALVGIAALTLLTVPRIRWAAIAGDLRWSALYAVNWRLADRAVDYLAADEAASPVQHFWSLAVEEQFYMVWPLLLLIAAAVALRRGTQLRIALGGALLIVGVPSLLWSIQLTTTDPGRAYFVSTTRLWELAVGGAVAVLAPHFARLPQRLAGLLSLAGIAGIVGTATSFDATTAFPGYSAALPITATAFVIGAGISAPESMVGRGLAKAAPIGRGSYSLYLWHWPLVVVASANWGPLSAWEGSAVVTASAVPAYLAYVLVERRWRYSAAIIDPPRRGLLVGAALTIVSLLAALVVGTVRPDTAASASEPPAVAAPVEIATTTTLPTPPAVTSTTTGLTTSTTLAPTTTTQTPPTTTVVGPIQPEAKLQLAAGTLTPDPFNARADLPAVYGDGCHQDQLSSDVLTCSYGAADAATEIAIVGDSHAAMWVPTLQAIAAEQDWRLRTITKSNCQLADLLIANGPQQRPYVNCAEWNENVIADLAELQPDLVVLAGRFWPTVVVDGEALEADAGESALAAGLERSWNRLRNAGLTLVAVRDIPYPAFDVAECVSERLTSLSDCAFALPTAMERNTAHATAATIAGIGLIDLTEQICLSDICPAVVDDVLVWRDTHHLTATYARLLAAAFAVQLEALTPELFPTEATGE